MLNWPSLHISTAIHSNFPASAALLQRAIYQKKTGSRQELVITSLIIIFFIRFKYSVHWLGMYAVYKVILPVTRSPSCSAHSHHNTFDYPPYAVLQFTYCTHIQCNVRRAGSGVWLSSFTSSPGTSCVTLAKLIKLSEPSLKTEILISIPQTTMT